MQKIKLAEDLIPDNEKAAMEENIDEDSKLQHFE